MGFGQINTVNNNSKSEEPKQLTQQEAVQKQITTIFEGMKKEDAKLAGLEVEFNNQDRNKNGIIELNELTTEQYIQYLEEQDALFKNNTNNEVRTRYIIENMINDGLDENAIIKYCHDNNINISEHIKNHDILNILKEKNYKNILNEAQGAESNESKLINLYSSNTSISDISKIIKKGNYPLDLSKNKEEVKVVLKEIKERYNNAKTLQEKNEIIKQLEMLTGISLKGKYNEKSADNVIKAFAVIYSLSQKLTSLGDNEGLIINGEKITDPKKIIEKINEKINEPTKDFKNNVKNKDIYDIIQDFSSACASELIVANKDNDSDSTTIDNIKEIVLQKRLYAKTLQEKLTELHNSPFSDEEKKNEALKILDPSIKIDNFLDINDYIKKAEEAITIIDNAFNSNTIKEKLEQDYRNYTDTTSQNLIKLFNSYNKIKDEYNQLKELSNKRDLTAEEQQKLNQYQKINDAYIKYIEKNNITPESLKNLQEVFENIDKKVFSDELIGEEELYQLDEKKERISSELVKNTIQRKKLATKENIAVMKEWMKIVPELNGKTKAEKIEILKEIISKDTEPSIKRMHEEMLKSVETFDDEDEAIVLEWSNAITLNNREDTDKMLGALVQKIRSKHPDLSENEIKNLLVTYVTMNATGNKSDLAFEINEYFARTSKAEDLTSAAGAFFASRNELWSEDDAKKITYNFREYALIVQNQAQYGIHKDAIVEYILDPDNGFSSDTIDMIRNLVNNNPDAYSDSVKEAVGYTGSNSSNASAATGGTGNSSNSDEMYGPYDNVFIMGTIDAPNYSHTNNNTTSDAPTPTVASTPTAQKINNTATNPITNNQNSSTLDILKEYRDNNELETALSTKKDKNGNKLQPQVVRCLLMSWWEAYAGKGAALDWAASNDLASDIINYIPNWEKYLPRSNKETQQVFKDIQKEETWLKQNIMGIDKIDMIYDQ